MQVVIEFYERGAHLGCLLIQDEEHGTPELTRQTLGAVVKSQVTHGLHRPGTRVVIEVR